MSTTRDIFQNNGWHIAFWMVAPIKPWKCQDMLLRKNLTFCHICPPGCLRQMWPQPWTHQNNGLLLVSGHTRRQLSRCLIYSSQQKPNLVALMVFFFTFPSVGGWYHSLREITLFSVELEQDLSNVTKAHLQLEMVTCVRMVGPTPSQLVSTENKYDLKVNTTVNSLTDCSWVKPKILRTEVAHNQRHLSTGISPHSQKHNKTFKMRHRPTLRSGQKPGTGRRAAHWSALKVQLT